MRPFDWDERRPLSEENLTALEGLYSDNSEEGSSAGLFAELNFDSAPSGAASDHAAAGGEVRVELKLQDERHLTATLYRGEDAVAMQRFSGKLSEEGYFELARQLDARARWYTLLFGGWVLRDQKVQLGLSAQGDLLMNTSTGGAVFVIFALPIFGTNWYGQHVFPRLSG